MVMSLDQNAGQNNDIKVDNISFETVEQLKWLGTTLRNQNLLYEESNCRLNSGSAFCHSVQNLSSSIFLCKNIKIKI